MIRALLLLLVAAAPAAARQTDADLSGTARSAVRATSRGEARAAATPVRHAQDPADSVYRKARELMGRGEYRQAAALFRSIQDRTPRSAYRDEAQYYEAYSLYRAGGSEDLRRARDVLRTFQADSARTTRALRRDALSLDTRICGELARRGDGQCAKVVRDRADGDLGAAVGGMVEGAAALARETLNSAEVRAALQDAQRETMRAAAEGAREAERALRSPEVQRAIAGAAAEGQRAAAEGVRAAADAMRGLSGGAASRPRRDPSCPDSDEDERVIALNALQRMEPGSAMPLLRKVMARREQCSENLRRRAVFIVARTKTPEAADLLITAARTDPDPEVREQAVYWLSSVDAERAGEFLREVVMKDTSVELRKRAAFALASTREPRNLQLLRTLAGTTSAPEEVRGEAIYWVAQRGENEGRWLRELYPTLQSRALKERVLYAQSRQKDATEWFMSIARDANEETSLRKSAMTYALRNASVEQIGQAYASFREREMKESALYALARRKEPEALDRLIAIARTEPDRDVRRNAVYWLSSSKDPKAVAFLQELIEK